MKITCSFYIGHQDYLSDDPNISESESREKLCSEVSTVIDRNIGNKQFEIYQANNPMELKAVLHINEKSVEAFGFSTETAVADDEDGLPVLFYVNAHFEVPDISNIDDFDGDVEAVLHVGQNSLPFEGLAEIDEE